MSIQFGFSRVAALMADPAREAMICALAGGRALPAGELADAAGVSPQSASGHLSKLVDGGLLSVWRQGRFRYFRLASDEVAQAVEALARVARPGPMRTIRGTSGGKALAEARCCYSHLAGRLGVALASALQTHGLVRVDGERAALTESGMRWVQAEGLSFCGRRGRPEEVRLCLDWTERRFHLSGPFATALLHELLRSGRLKRQSGRSLAVTAEGKRWLAALGVEA